MRRPRRRCPLPQRLLKRLRASRLDNSHDTAIRKLLRVDLLIIDDMGMKQLPKKSGEFLFEIIMRRHELRSTMMTSNRPLEDWGKLIGDVPSATAILDRFLHHAELITINGKSYRLRDRPENSKCTKAPPGSSTDNKSTKRNKARTKAPERN